MFLLAAMVSPVLAQEVDKAPTRANWLTVLLAVVLVVAVAVVSFVSSKRTHQD